MIIFLYTINPFEVKYQFSIKKQESTNLKHLNDSKAFIEYSIDMDDTIQIKNVKY